MCMKVRQIPSRRLSLPFRCDAGLRIQRFPGALPAKRKTREIRDFLARECAETL